MLDRGRRLRGGGVGGREGTGREGSPPPNFNVRGPTIKVDDTRQTRRGPTFQYAPIFEKIEKILNIMIG